ncbi:TetR/AcrR family transcriptional regulator [Boseaceae bacterium BT-24-1]|nr:TetR/AcrR family transcriptional regulator [Boseaceae bacterium BT-24-1]
MMATGQALTRRDWVKAALAALAEGGVEAVKVERLARSLSVSKGSFYWHFKDRGDLLAALLAFWQDELTAQLIERSADLPTPRQRLETLAQLSLEAESEGVNVAEAEGALRAWAAQDAAAGHGCRLVDQQRIDHVASELALAGLAPAEAELAARAIYLTLLGIYAARRYTPELAGDAPFRAIVAIVLDAAAQSSARAG